MSLPKSLLFNHSRMYAKRGGVAAYHIIWIGLCLRSVPGVRVLASPVDDQRHYYLTTFVCILSVVVWQHIILFGSVCA